MSPVFDDIKEQISEELREALLSTVYCKQETDFGSLRSFLDESLSNISSKTGVQFKIVSIEPPTPHEESEELKLIKEVMEESPSPTEMVNVTLEIEPIVPIDFVKCEFEIK